MVKDPEVADPIRFLRKREIVHFQRFGETLRDVQEHLNSRNFYAFNPAFDLPQGPNCAQRPASCSPAAYTGNNCSSPCTGNNGSSVCPANNLN